jgi:glutathione synthase/RimK-type ligase-like ATP-grasp enzyme
VRILILATGFKPQYRVLRCASALRHEVFVAGQAGALLLGFSRYCTRLYRCDFQNWHQSKVVEFINSLIERLGIDVVLPSDAITTTLLARIGSELTSKVYPVPPERLFERLGNKDSFMKLCSTLGVRHPRSLLVRDPHELKKIVSRGEFTAPFVVKSVNRSGGDGIFRVLNGRDLQSISKMIDYAPILIQEYVPGSDISLSLFCSSGKPIAAVVFERDSKSFRCVSHASFRAEAERIAAATQFDGVINFDGILTASGEVVFLECNPRFFYSMDLVMLASGINFVGTGLGDEAGRADGERDVHPIRLWRSIASSIFSPWRLENSDLSFVRYTLADPVAAVLLATSFDLRFPAAAAALSAYALRRTARARALPQRLPS